MYKWLRQRKQILENDWCINTLALIYLSERNVEKSQKGQSSLEEKVKRLTGAGEPLSIGTELDGRDCFSVAS